MFHQLVAWLASTVGSWEYPGIIVIGTSRLYLGVHWLSDVLGGLLISTSWPALLEIVYLKGPADIVPRRLLKLVTILVIVIAGGWHVGQRHAKDHAFYAPRYNLKAMTLATWLA